MTVQIRGVQTNAAVSAATITVAPPSGTQAGDLLIMVASWSNKGFGLISIPDGWTPWPGAYVQAIHSCILLYRIATASEPANYTVGTSSGAQQVIADIIGFYSSTAALLKIEDLQTQYNGVADFTFPSVTFAASAGILACFGVGDSSSATPSAGFTEQWDHDSSIRMYCQTKTIAASGATGGFATTGTDQSNCGFSVAIAEGTFVIPSGPQFRDYVGVTAAAVTSQTVSAPANVKVGDLLICGIGYGSSGATPAITGGWTAVTNGSITGAYGAYLFYRRATSADIGATYTITWGGSSRTVRVALFCLFSPLGYVLTIDACQQTAGTAQDIVFPSASATDPHEAWLMWDNSQNTLTTVITDGTVGAFRITDTGNTAPRQTALFKMLVASGASGTTTITRGGSIPPDTTQIFSLLVREVPVPGDPSSLVAVASGTTSIALSWSDNASNEDSYKIEHSTDGSSWSALVTLSANTTSYSHTGLSEHTIHYYRVYAYNNISGSSATSNTANTTTDLAAPSGLSATVYSASQINLAWTDNSLAESGYKVERSSNGTTGWTVVATTATNATSYSHTGLNQNTKYYYRVRAYNGSDYSDYSGTANATTLPSPATLLAAVAIAHDEVDLSWTDNASGEDGYKVERSPNGSTGWTQIGTAAANATNYQDLTVVALTTYYYRVRPYTNTPAQNGAYSNIASVTTPDPFVAPTDLTLNVLSVRRIQLNWVGNNPDQQTTQIERSPNGVTNWALIATVGTGVETYTDAGLTPGTQYFYKVRDVKVE